GEGLDTADTLEASAGCHRFLHDGVQGYVFQGALGELAYRFVYVFVLADPLIDHSFLGDYLARSCRIQLVGCLRIQPGYGAAQAQTFRCYHTYVARGEGLAHDTAVVYVYGFICHGSDSFIAVVEGRDRHLMTDSRTVFVIGVDLHLAFIHYCFKFALDSRVQHLCQVFRAESCVEGVLADTQTDHIPLSGMHNAFDAVHVVVELTLEYRLEIRLHALSGYLYHVGDAVLAAHFEFVEVFSDQLKADRKSTRLNSSHVSISYAVF